METSKILTADALDILFDGRNKEYGAYDLRKTYNDRIKISITGMFLVCAFCLGASLFANSKEEKKNELLITDMELMKVKDEKKVEPPPPPLPKPEPQKVEMAKFTPPQIVNDEEVKPDEEVKDIEKLEDARIGTIDTKGKIDDGTVIDPPVEAATGVVASPKVEPDIDKIVAFVSIQAQFPGGMDGWKKYLERYLNRDLPAENGAPPADYTVTVSFIVDRFGNISDVKAENDPGYGTKAEAIRVILKSPKWTPAEQNGRQVVYRQKQNITFRVSVD